MNDELRRYMVGRIIEKLKAVSDADVRLRACEGGRAEARELLAEIDRVTAEIAGYVEAFNDMTGLRWSYDAGDNVVRNKYAVALTMDDMAA